MKLLNLLSRLTVFLIFPMFLININSLCAFTLDSNDSPQLIESTFSIKPADEFKYNLVVPGSSHLSSSATKVDLGVIFSLDGCNIDKSLGLRFFLEENPMSTCQIKEISGHKVVEIQLYMDSNMDISGGNKLNVNIQPVLENQVHEFLIGSVYQMEIEALTKNYASLITQKRGDLTKAITVPYSYSTNPDHILSKKYRIKITIPIKGKYVEKTIYYKILYNFSVENL